jgi:hypothetical protein
MGHRYPRRSPLLPGSGLSLLFLALAISASCSCDRAQQQDAGPITQADIGFSDQGVVKPERDGTVGNDGTAIQDLGGDTTLVGPSVITGEIAPGSGVSTGGGYTLHSRIGLQVAPQPLKGSTYTLESHVTVVPRVAP